jgi:N-acetylglucosamine-6-phosphate deacetylase
MPDEMVIRGARVVAGNKVSDPGWVHIKSGRIAAVGQGLPPADLEAGATDVIDAKGQWLVPGFIDMHVHGGGGAEVMDGTAGAIRSIARFHAQHGTTGWLPTTLTAPIEAIRRSLAAVEAACEAEVQTPTGAAVLGVHLEGPFIAPERPGAQDPAHIQDPQPSLITQLLEAVPGIVRKITMAPERPGALEAVRRLRDQGVIVSIGHTDATAAQARTAIEAGATHATHLFNAMRGLHHRDIGTAGACLLADEVVCELICDGLHVDFEMVQLVLRLKRPDRIVLITDAIGPTGCEPGRYRLGTVDIQVDGHKSVLTSDGRTLAGSVLTMEQAVANVVERAGASVCDAVAMASTVPARELGLGHRKGTIAPGYDADLVLLDEAWTVTRTWVAGRDVYCRS